MKAIGGILVALGLGVCLFAGVTLARANGAAVEAGGRQLEQVGTTYLLVPLVLGFAVIATGIGMLVFGGKGIYRGRPPARPTQPPAAGR